jgi:hypothetical protein
MLINITLLVYSGTTGVQIGNEVIEDYKDVLSDKVSFLKSFCNEYIQDVPQDTSNTLKSEIVNKEDKK